jgi:hypothetical protein
MMHYVRWWKISAVGLALWLTAAPGYAQQSGATAGQIEEKAMSTLMRAAEFLAKAQRFSVTADISYDIMQDSGQKLEFGATRKIIVHRPDRISVDIEDRDGTRRGFRFDGKQIAFFGLDEKVYATAEKSGDLDAAFAYFTRDLQMPLPMGELFTNNLPKSLKDRVSEAYYVEEEKRGGLPCDHLALRNDMTDAQVWIAKGDQPLLRRLVITYKHANGQPEFRADFRDWNFSPEVPDSLFTFTPAEGAIRIQFVAR